VRFGDPGAYCGFGREPVSLPRILNNHLEAVAIAAKV
jgi:hypothetical protein